MWFSGIDERTYWAGLLFMLAADACVAIVPIYMILAIRDRLRGRGWIEEAKRRGVEEAEGGGDDLPRTHFDGAVGLDIDAGL